MERAEALEKLLHWTKELDKSAVHQVCVMNFCVRK